MNYKNIEMINLSNFFYPFILNMFKIINDPNNHNKVNVKSIKGKKILQNYAFYIAGFQNISHKILGTKEYLNNLLKKTNFIWNRLKIKNYSDSNQKLRIMGSTVPHAGFEFSGLLATLTIKQIMETIKNDNKNNKLTILWFKHNPNSNQEHSLENIKLLVKLIDSKIKINNLFIDHESNFNELNIDDYVLASTDFSHHNYGKPARDMYQVFENDYQILNKNNVINKVEPCGKDTIKIFKEWINKNNLEVILAGYSDSDQKENWWYEFQKNKQFSGVTYASLNSFKNNNHHLDILKNKLLAYPHLMWVNDFLKSNIKNPNKGLHWSPLNKIKGSSFITVYQLGSNQEQTYSCFGAWETENQNIMNSIKSASNTVKIAKWGNNGPVNNYILKNLLNNKYKISISLIEPIKFWKKVNMNNLEKAQKNRGYVYYNEKNNNVGMTYLPSVWESFNTKKGFFSGLIDKHKNVYSSVSGWNLYSYQAISWSFIY